MNALPNDSYLAAHRYDHDRVETDTRAALTPIPIQRRDMAIVRDVWRYKLLASAQLHELWWPGRTPRAAQKRLTRLFEAGLLERFRPVTRRGSYPWIYQLGPEGHRLLRHAGLIPERQRYERRDVYDYTYVLHDLHLNSWVLAYRRLLKDALLEWEGETAIEPPPAARNSQLHLDDSWSVEGLKADRPRAVVPDAALELVGPDGEGSRVFMVEYDRTSRVDKNYEKFQRYDAFLSWWWRHTHYGQHGQPPFVLFVCQNERTATSSSPPQTETSLAGSGTPPPPPAPPTTQAGTEPCSPVSPTPTPASSKHTECRPTHQATQTAKAPTPNPAAYDYQVPNERRTLDLTRRRRPIQETERCRHMRWMEGQRDWSDRHQDRGGATAAHQARCPYSGRAT